MMNFKGEERTRARKTGANASMVAAATPVTVFILSAGRTAKLVKVVGYNGQAADVTLEIGTGLAPFVRVLPRIRMIAQMPLFITEEECGEFEFEANITAQVSAAGAAPLNVELQATVEEIGG